MAALEQAENQEAESTEGDEPGIDVEALKKEREEHAKELDRYRNQVGQAKKEGEELTAQVADLTAKLKAQTDAGQTAEERAQAAVAEQLDALTKKLEAVETDANSSKAEAIAGRRRIALSTAGVTGDNSATMAKLLEGSTDEELTAEVEALKTSFPAAFTEPNAPAPKGASSPPGRPGVKPKPAGQEAQERMKAIRENKDLSPREATRQTLEALSTPLEE